jgi:predicted glycosyltransferase involved in capsule biosynthesis
LTTIFPGKKLNEQRTEVLKNVSDLKQELRGMEATFAEKNKKYESIKAYSKVSAIEVSR